MRSFQCMRRQLVDESAQKNTQAQIEVNFFRYQQVRDDGVLSF